MFFIVFQVREPGDGNMSGENKFNMANFLKKNNEAIGYQGLQVLRLGE